MWSKRKSNCFTRKDIQGPVWYNPSILPILSCVVFLISTWLSFCSSKTPSPFLSQGCICCSFCLRLFSPRLWPLSVSSLKAQPQMSPFQRGILYLKEPFSITLPILLIYSFRATYCDLKSHFVCLLENSNIADTLSLKFFTASSLEWALVCCRCPQDICWLEGSVFDMGLLLYNLVSERSEEHW